MKKSTLALSMAAAIASFGFLGSASAIGVLENNATVGMGNSGLGFPVAVGTYAATASVLALNNDGIGHQLVVPYYSVQNANTTMVNVTNTDLVNGKLVKVRFRGAANSDDVLDFQLLMSPGDVWTGVVVQDPMTNLATLKTTDATCTLPDSIRTSATGTSFFATRTDPTPALGTAANQTREGYIEIINMADIPKPALSVATTATVIGTNDIGTSTAAGGEYAAMTAVQKAATVYGTIKHASNVAACDATVLSTKLVSDFATYKLANAAGLSAPTGGLSADWIILNQTNTAAWSGAATALKATGPGNLVYWPQKGAVPAITGTTAAPNTAIAVTADPLFTSAVVTMQNNDLPDLSTQYGATSATAAAHADATSALIAVTSISNQFVTGSGIAAVTDMVFTQPTRRYSVAVNYAATGTAVAALTGDTDKTGTRAAAIYRDQTNANTTYTATGSVTHGKNNTSLVARQVCLNSIAPPSYLNREEGVVLNGFSASPGLASTFSLCGEAAVASFNMTNVTNGSALNASVVRNDMVLAYETGWATFDTTNQKVNTVAVISNVAGGATAFVALPILGASHMRVANGAVNYGFTTSNKVTR